MQKRKTNLNANDQNDLLMVFIEHIVQWFYVSQKISGFLRIVFSILAFISLAVLLSLSLLLVGEMLSIKNSFSDYFLMVSSLLFFFILLNWGRAKEYSKIVLSYWYILRNKKRENSIKKVAWLLLIMLVFCVFLKGLEKIVQSMGLQGMDAILLEFVIVSLAVFIPMSEFVVDRIKFHKMKTIVSSIQFCVVLGLYMKYLQNVEYDSNRSFLYEIAIFAVGQIAFAETAVSNYKSMYIELGKVMKPELELYFESVDRKYHNLEMQAVNYCGESKQFLMEMRDIWIHANVGQRFKMIAIAIGIVIGFVLIVLLAFLHA